MAPKRHKHLSHNHLGDTKASTGIQQDIKNMPPLPPRKISYHHQPITKHPAKQKNLKFFQNVGTKTNIFSLTLQPIHITQLYTSTHIKKKSNDSTPHHT